MSLEAHAHHSHEHHHHAVAPDADRRRLAERWGKEREEEVFEALFHREPPSERDFARCAHRHGLAPFLARPLPRAPVLRTENLRLGGVLALVAELWLRLGRSEEQGQAFYRAARWIDNTAYDVAGLERDGNLPVLPLDPQSRAVAAEFLETGDAELLTALLAEYVAPLEIAEPTRTDHADEIWDANVAPASPSPPDPLSHPLPPTGRGGEKPLSES